MQLNIKDETVYRLARKLATETGQSVTAAVRSALEEKDARLEARRRRAPLSDVKAMLRGSRRLFKPEFDHLELSTQHGELLYDERGLPG